MSLKVLIFCTLLVTIFANSELLAQCEKQHVDLKHQVSKAPDGSTEVTIQLPTDLNITRIQLYDLNNGRIVGEDKVIDLEKTELVFKAVKPSIYMFYVWISECDKPLVYSGGNKTGIVVEIGMRR